MIYFLNWCSDFFHFFLFFFSLRLFRCLFSSVSLSLLVCLCDCACLFSFSVCLLASFQNLFVCLSTPHLCFCLFVTNSPTLFVCYWAFFVLSSPSHFLRRLSVISFVSKFNSFFFVSALSANKALCFYSSRTHRKEPPNYAQTVGLVKEKKTSKLNCLPKSIYA